MNAKQQKSSLAKVYPNPVSPWVVTYMWYNIIRPIRENKSAKMWKSSPHKFNPMKIKVHRLYCNTCKDTEWFLILLSALFCFGAQCFIGCLTSNTVYNTPWWHHAPVWPIYSVETHYISPFHTGTAIRIQTRFWIRIDWGWSGYIHMGSKGAVVNNCIPEVFIDIATHAYLVQNKMAAA